MGVCVLKQRLRNCCLAKQEETSEVQEAVKFIAGIEQPPKALKKPLSFSNPRAILSSRKAECSAATTSKHCLEVAAYILLWRPAWPFSNSRLGIQGSSWFAKERKKEASIHRKEYLMQKIIYSED